MFPSIDIVRIVSTTKYCRWPNKGGEFELGSAQFLSTQNNF
jgi:hypothetical protein